MNQKFAIPLISNHIIDNNDKQIETKPNKQVGIPQTTGLPFFATQAQLENTEPLIRLDLGFRQRRGRHIQG